MSHPVNPTDELGLATIVETCLYSENLAEMERFYRQVLKLPVIGHEDGRHIFFSVGSGTVLLIFNPTVTAHGHHLPPHGASGSIHVAFGIAATEVDAWRTHLLSQAITIEQEQDWPKGGHSLYFRDPAGNLLELVTPRIWGTAAGW